MVKAGWKGKHLRLPLHADGIEAVLCHRLQQATVPQLPLQLHPERELPGSASPTGAPIRPTPTQPQASIQALLVCHDPATDHEQQQASAIIGRCMQGQHECSSAPADAVAWVGGIVVGFQPQQPVQQLIKVHLPVVSDLRHLAKLKPQPLQDLQLTTAELCITSRRQDPVESRMSGRSAICR